MQFVINKIDEIYNILILVFYNERFIINRCRKLVDNNLKNGVDNMDKAKEALWTKSFVLDTLINFLVFLIYYLQQAYAQ